MFELSQYRDKCPDHLTNRIFGGAISITGGKTIGNNKIVTTAQKALCKILAESIQNRTEDEFTELLKQRRDNALSTEKAFKETKKFWNGYWNKSYIFVEGDKRITPELNHEVMDGKSYETYDDKINDLSPVTQAYILGLVRKMGKSRNKTIYQSFISDFPDIIQP